ncbi:MAG: hypothetical protein WBZ36_28075 [Candidatus Nitrosopolaris sp.]
MSDKERQTQMEELRTPNPYEGSKAVEALAAYGEEAIPSCAYTCELASLTDTHVKEAAKSEIDKIKKGLKP